MLAATQPCSTRPILKPHHERIVPTLISSKRTCQILPLRATTAAGVDLSTSAAVSIIKQAVAKPNSVPAPAVLDAMLQLEAAKLPEEQPLQPQLLFMSACGWMDALQPEGWLDLLQAAGARWRLVFTADAKQVQAAKKKQPNKGGVYFPLAACQKFQSSNMDFENGVFLGPIASLTFNGPYSMKGRQLSFDVIAMKIGVGPWTFSIPLKKGAAVPIAAMDAQDAKKLPFFLYSYIDDEIVVARGRSGGLAIWERSTKEWEAKAGVLQRYS